MTDLLRSAQSAVDAQPRHSRETLFDLLASYYPDATDAEIDAVIDKALP